MEGRTMKTTDKFTMVLMGLVVAAGVVMAIAARIADKALGL